MNRLPMTMTQWIAKLDDFLKLSVRELFKHAGTISADDAQAKAEREYTRYRKQLDTQPQRIDDDFDNAAKQIKSSLPPNRPKNLAAKKTIPPE